MTCSNKKHIKQNVYNSSEWHSQRNRGKPNRQPQKTKRKPKRKTQQTKGDPKQNHRSFHPGSWCSGYLGPKAYERMRRKGAHAVQALFVSLSHRCSGETRIWTGSLVLRLTISLYKPHLEGRVFSTRIPGRFHCRILDSPLILRFGMWICELPRWTAAVTMQLRTNESLEATHLYVPWEDALPLAR